MITGRDMPEPGGGHLIDWTGERAVPWMDDVQVMYEHLHRYHWISALARNRAVLELASGEGYGAAILAAVADRVVGVDLDPIAVAHSRLAYPRPNLEFIEGSMTEPRLVAPQSFDLVTCFEAIEHVADHQALLNLVVHALRPGGLLAISTPDRDVYTGEAQPPNPYHLHELNRAELVDLLQARFAHVAVWGQTATTGSLMVPLSIANDRGEVIAVSGGDAGWRRRELPPPTYLVALASAAPLPEVPGMSLLCDTELRLVRSGDPHAVRALEEERTRLEMELRANEAVRVPQVERLEAHIRQLTLQVQELQVAHHDLGVAHAESGRSRIAMEAVGAQLDAIVNSRGWRAVTRYRRLHHALITPLHTRRRGRPEPAGSSAPEGEPPAETQSAATCEAVDVLDEPQLELPRFTLPAEPEASIIIPVHGRLTETLVCLRSLAAHVPAGRHEIIAVDDASPDHTPDVLARIEGLRLVRRRHNGGFTEAITAGAEIARGRHLVFLNNDTEVHPGWIEGLLEVVDSDPGAGAVGSRLVYYDGRLQEAGSLVWNDGSAWNLGCRDDAAAPAYNVRRDVDYCSAASLLVRHDLYRQVGGLDQRFHPAYYEDADLCFALRAAGYRVVYQPTSVVTHHSGLSYGTDDEPGPVPNSRRLQMAVNRPLFAAKWAAELEHHWPPGAPRGLLTGRGRIDRRRNVLICDDLVPAHDRDAGGVRMHHIARLLAELGCRVTIAPENGYRREPYTTEFQSLGIEVWYGPQTIADLFAERTGFYDMVILSRVTIAAGLIEPVRRHFPDAVVLFDTVDLHHMREQRRLDLLNVDTTDGCAELRLAELATMRASDVVATVSEEERELVTALVPGTPTVVLPTVHPVRHDPAPPPSGRSGLLFIGGFRHDPNVDAVVWFVHDVLPKVISRIGTTPRLTILGTEPTPEVVALRSPTVEVTGHMPDVDAYFDAARVFVAPLRYGAGMKGKCGHAFSRGLPIVTTSLGAEGFAVTDGREALLRDDADSFADAVVTLLQNDELWRSLSSSGLQLIRDHLTPEHMSKRLADLLATWCPTSPDSGRAPVGGIPPERGSGPVTSRPGARR